MPVDGVSQSPKLISVLAHILPLLQGEADISQLKQAIQLHILRKTAAVGLKGYDCAQLLFFVHQRFQRLEDTVLANRHAFGITVHFVVYNDFIKYQ
ncbi:hypothetical protein D3C74_327130 [compost metagenome]